MKPIVSAIITTCNRSPEIVTRALESVANQTYPRMQIIVVDDSPADFPERADVRSAVVYICPRAMYIAHETNRGPSAARNTGISAAEGEFVAFLDDDDEWLPEKISDQLAGFTRESIALVYGDTIYANDVRLTKHLSSRKRGYSGRVFEKLLESCFISGTSNPLFRKRCLQEIGGFDLEMRSTEDYDVYLRLAQKYEVCYIPKPCMFYHIHDGIRVSTNDYNKTLAYERMMDRYSDDYAHHPRILIARHRFIIPYYKRSGNTSKALKTWLFVLQREPLCIIRNLKSLFFVFFTRDCTLFQWHSRIRNRLVAVKRKLKHGLRNKHPKRPMALKLV